MSVNIWEKLYEGGSIVHMGEKGGNNEIEIEIGKQSYFNWY